MPSTIKDIAKRAGVSHSTVSRALRGSPLISESTTEGIRQIAQELGYMPRAAARSLKTNRSQVLGVVVSSMNDPFFGEILQGIEDGAQESGYSLFIAASQRDLVREQKIVQSMMEHRVDGVIICSTTFSAEKGRQFLAYGLPIVVINNQSAEDYRYSIYHDDVDGSRQVTRHLIELGHLRIAYLGNSLSGRTTFDRQTGYLQEMESANLPIPQGYTYEIAGGEPQNGLDALKHFLDLSIVPTALVCYNDMLAVGMLKGLQQIGIKVPEDISVAGFDNIVFSTYTNPPLTTFDQPKQFIGSEAARLVIDLLQAHNDDPATAGPKIRILKGRLLVRQSTAPPPG